MYLVFVLPFISTDNFQKSENEQWVAQIFTIRLVEKSHSGRNCTASPYWYSAFCHSRLGRSQGYRHAPYPRYPLHSWWTYQGAWLGLTLPPCPSYDGPLSQLYYRGPYFAYLTAYWKIFSPPAPSLFLFVLRLTMSILWGRYGYWGRVLTNQFTGAWTHYTDTV